MKHIYSVESGQHLVSIGGDNSDLKTLLTQFGEVFISSGALEHPEYYECIDGGLERVADWESKLSVALEVEAQALSDLQSDTLSTLMHQMKLSIDQQAEVQRGRFLTQGSGQAMEYQETQAELVRYAADESPTEDKYPFLSADIGVNGDTLAEVAATVGAISQLWHEAGPVIKARRIRAKKEVERCFSLGDQDGMKQATIIDWTEIDALLN